MPLYKIGNKLLSNGAGKMFGFTVPPPEPHRSNIGPQSGAYYINTLPIETSSLYSFSQQIYTADLINFAGNITGIVFFPESSYLDGRTIKVYLSIIDNTKFTSKKSIPVLDSDCIFGPSKVIIEKDKPLIFNLENPLYYDGIKNLLLTVVDDSGTWDKKTNFYNAVQGTTLQSLYKTGSEPFNPKQTYYGLTIVK